MRVKSLIACLCLMASPALAGDPSTIIEQSGPPNSVVEIYDFSGEMVLARINYDGSLWIRGGMSIDKVIDEATRQISFHGDRSKKYDCTIELQGGSPRWDICLKPDGSYSANGLDLPSYESEFFSK